MVWRILIAVGLALAVAWVALVVFLVAARPKGSVLKEALRILPDTLRLLRRLATDRALPRSLRVRLWLLFAYLAIPIDLVPDFIPVIGYVDDAVIVAVVLSSVVRRAGREAVVRHWPGTRARHTVAGRLASSRMRPNVPARMVSRFDCLAVSPIPSELPRVCDASRLPRRCRSVNPRLIGWARRGGPSCRFGCSVRPHDPQFGSCRPTLRREGHRHSHLVVGGVDPEIEEWAAPPLGLDEPPEGPGGGLASAVDEQSAIGLGLGPDEGPTFEGSPFHSTSGHLLVLEGAYVRGFGHLSPTLAETDGRELACGVRSRSMILSSPTVVAVVSWRVVLSSPSISLLHAASCGPEHG